MVTDINIREKSIDSIQCFTINHHSVIAKFQNAKIHVQVGA